MRGPRYGVGSRWRAVWEEPGGQRRRKSFVTKDAAQAHLEHVAVDLRSGTYVSPKSAAAPFRDVAERWYSAQVHQRATTLRLIRSRLDRTILPALGDMPIGRLDRATVQAAVTQWGSAMAPSTVRVTYVYVAGICALAVEDRLIAQTPCRRVNLPALDNPLVVPYTVEQVQAIVDAAGERYRPMLVLGAASGVRSGELRGLTWDRVADHDDGTASLLIDRQLTRATSASKPAFGPLKTRYSVRRIAIGRATREALGERGNGLVFTTTKGGAITHKVAWTIWRSAADQALAPASAEMLDAAGDKDGWHELRHFHASLLIAGGASPVAVAHRLGHKDATETLQTYGHLWADDEERMRDASDGLVVLPAESSERDS
ncbi:MAG: site-specific integrase [Cellulomonas sp.]|nr:site-specific integrase [Cellulomonas sp.]MCR6647759.1 site-specific integrase [Cellulomonas sp.]